jgi:hypothetical protein
MCIFLASGERFDVRDKIPLCVERITLPSGSWAGRPGLVGTRSVQGVCISPRWMFAPESAIALLVLSPVVDWR